MATKKQTQKQKSLKALRQICEGTRCYDCGSPIKNHHTKNCEMAPKGAVRDLPNVLHAQWWDRNAIQPSDTATLAAMKDRKEFGY
jgi:DNA repair exonuclease SbcCD ATPase subunit